MANATVEKLKTLGIRHGEKAAVALTGVLFVLFLVLALKKESFPLSTAEVKDHARQAEQNINRQQSEEDILKKIEEAGITETSFAKKVVEQSKAALDAQKFALNGPPWVTLEPHAGLIRDVPVLIAPTDLYARAGRGGLLMYRLDENGEKQVKVVSDEPTKTKKKRRKGRRAPTNAYSGMMGGGGYGQMAGGTAKKSGEETAEEKKKREFEERKRREGLAGREKVTDEDKTKKDEDTGAKKEYEDSVVGKRWVALVATVDNKKLRENYATALKIDFSSAFPNYQRLELERQVRNDDGTWTDWQAVDREKNLEVLQNIPEAEDEPTPEDVRLDALVDYLPFLRAGLWKGVHIASLVPAEKREVAKQPTTVMGGEGEGMMGAAAMKGGYGGGYGGAGMSGQGSGGYGGMKMGGYGQMSDGEGGGYGGMGAGGAANETADFPHSEKDTIMARSLDFTVEPEATYRYRMRIVVANPNKAHENVSHGVDTEVDELKGPWSDPSPEVTVPADVTAYAMNKSPGNDRNGRPDAVQFQVARWTPDDGMTVIRTFDAAPGQVIGEQRSVEVPVFEENLTGKDKDKEQTTRAKPVDFNTHQVVLNTDGGALPLPKLNGLTGTNFEEPAQALLLRPDGKVVLRDEAVDTHNDEMAEMKSIYQAALDEAKGSKSSSAGGTSPMGGGYGGGYGGGAAGYGGMNPGARKRGGR